MKYERNYIKGKEDGLWKGWYENGQLQYEMNYKYGKREGIWNYYNEAGKLIKKVTYGQDVLIKTETF